MSCWDHQGESHWYLFLRQYQRVQERSLPDQVAQQETLQQRMVLLVTLVTQTRQRDLIRNLQYQDHRHFRFPRRQSQEMLLQGHLHGFHHFQKPHQNQKRVPNQLASRYFHYFLDLDQILNRRQMAQGHRVLPRHQGQKNLDSGRHQHLQVDQRAPSSLAVQPSLRVRQSRDLYLLDQLHLARSLADHDCCFQVQKILLPVLVVFQCLDVH